MGGRRRRGGKVSMSFIFCGEMGLSFVESFALSDLIFTPMFPMFYLQMTSWSQ